MMCGMLNIIVIIIEVIYVFLVLRFEICFLNGLYIFWYLLMVIIVKIIEEVVIVILSI